VGSKDVMAQPEQARGDERKDRQVTAGGERTTFLLRLAHWQLRRRASRHHRSRKRAAVAVAGTLVAIAMAAAAFAYWTTTGTGPGQAQAATVSNLAITAVATPSPVNQLYPGSTGDVVLQIANPNVFPVTITAVSLPSATSYATGYANSNLTGAIAGCTTSGATASLVAWNYASNSNPHTLSTSLTVAANGTLTVTMTNDAAMGTGSPTACEGAYFEMAPLTGVTASSSNSSATPSPATDSWSS
jgi:hypothetical protein